MYIVESYIWEVCIIGEDLQKMNRLRMFNTEMHKITSLNPILNIPL